jgi:hypothetical protein
MRMLVRSLIKLTLFVSKSSYVNSYLNEALRATMWEDYWEQGMK